MYKPFKKIILRTPLKPINYFKNFLIKSNDTGALLNEIINDNVIKEAFYLASPNLYSKITKLSEGKITDKKEIDKLEQSVFKYISRMSSRSTPFGLFAGISVGEISEESNIKLQDVSNNKRNLRLDMNYLVSLAIKLSKIPKIKKQLKFYRNTSIYIVDDKLRYIEYEYIKSKRIHHIVAVNNSEYLEKILNVAEKGSKIKKLADCLIDKEVTFKESEYFINELIDSQILIPELEPSVTGDDFLNQIILVINKLNGINSVKKKLTGLKENIKDINKKKLGIDILKYEEIINKLKDLYPDFDTKYMFQADMLKPVKELTVNTEITKAILNGIEVLNRFTQKPAETNITKFRDAYYERYEDAEMPLLKVLDTEIGIGYLQNNSSSGVLSPLIDNIALQVGNNNSSQKINWNSTNSFLLKKYTQTIKENKYEIIITDEEINKYTKETGQTDLPLTIYAMVQIFKSNKGEDIYMSSTGGPSAVNLMGRFAHTDKNIQDLILEITDFEQKTDSSRIYAEIVHLPESRTGNILLRPTIRKYEIPYLAKPSVKKEKIIHPKDLMISVKSNRIVLRSKKINKEIIPRLGNAHNYSYTALPVYQFLCDLQAQNLRGSIGFNWGPLENEFTFLPRVKYKNIIFSVAKWRIQKNDFNKIIKIKPEEKNSKIKDKNELLAAIKNWRIKNKIPVWTALEDGDNKLTLNLKNILSIKTLISLVKNRPNFVLSEFILNKDNAFIKDGDNYYANEFIFAFKKYPDIKVNKINRK